MCSSRQGASCRCECRETEKTPGSCRAHSLSVDKWERSTHSPISTMALRNGNVTQMLGINNSGENKRHTAWVRWGAAKASVVAVLCPLLLTKSALHPDANLRWGGAKPSQFHGNGTQVPLLPAPVSKHFAFGSNSSFMYIKLSSLLSSFPSLHPLMSQSLPWQQLIPALLHWTVMFRDFTVLMLRDSYWARDTFLSTCPRSPGFTLTDTPARRFHYFSQTRGNWVERG